jgi:hypothetical protein
MSWTFWQKRESEEEMEDNGMEGKRQKLEAESSENVLKEKKMKLLEEQMVIDAELLWIKTIKNAALIEQNKLLSIERQKRAPEKKAFELLNELKKKLDEAVKNTKICDEFVDDAHQSKQTFHQNIFSIYFFIVFIWIPELRYEKY